MSTLLGADTRRVDVIAEGLRACSQDVHELRTKAQRVVAEMRNAWGGQDFERLAQRWEQEAGPQLAEASSALITMATALRAHAERQRQASGDIGGSGGPAGVAGAPGGLLPGGGGAVASWGTDRTRVDDLDADGLDADDLVNRHWGGVEKSHRIDVIGQMGPEPTFGDKMKDNVKVNLAAGVVEVDASLASMTGGEAFRYELAAGKVEAGGVYSVDVDAHGNLVGSAGASAAAYLGYAAGKLSLGSDLANGTVGGKAYVGAEVRADASGSIGLSGAKGNLGAEAFAGGKAVVHGSGTVAGSTAAAGAEVSFGIGARANLDAALSLTEVGVSADIGAALGVGAGVIFDVSVNPQEVMASVDSAVDDIGDAAENFGRGLGSAGDEVASFLHW